MVEAIITDSGVVMPVCAWVTGQYGIDDVYLGVLAKLGAGGVVEVYEAALTDTETKGLQEAAVAVKAKVAEMTDVDY
jgi:malate dehydrogenase